VQIRTGTAETAVREYDALVLGEMDMTNRIFD
jgi:hypothetical protein